METSDEHRNSHNLRTNTTVDVFPPCWSDLLEEVYQKLTPSSARTRLH